jgi:hypothetical protein
MSTTPSAATGQITSEVKAVGVFLTTHHIVLYLALAAFGAFGIYEIESKIASIQEARATAAEHALAVEKDHSSQLAAAFAANEAERQKENAIFVASIAQIQAQTKTQIIHDQALPAPELGHRIETLTGFKQGTITLDSSQDLLVPLPLGQEIVAKLDQGLADAQTVTQQAGIIKNQKGTIDEQAGIIKQDAVVLAGQIKTDGEVLKAANDKARKSKLKWFAAGAVFGFVGRQFVHFGL